MPTPSRVFWGPLTVLGLIAAVIAGVLDQASKFWLLGAFDLANKGVVKLMPFVDIVLTWNTGISYGLLDRHNAALQDALLAFKAAALIFLWIWRMLRLVDVASASISLTTRCGVAGRPKCFPRVSAALMPAVTRSLMSEDSSSAIAPMMVNIARPIGLSVST